MVDVLPDEVRPGGLYNGTRAAKLLGVARSTLWRWTREGLIRPRMHSVTRVPMYRGCDLIALHRGSIK